MSDQTSLSTFFGRIGNLFRRNNRDGELSQAQLPALPDNTNGENVLNGQIEPRTTFLRPWVKRDQAIDQLQNGVAALSDLMGTIRDNLEKQSHRQDELLNYLSHLPEALQTLPETSRVQGEALRTIQQQIAQQNTQQSKLADVLERIHQADTDNRRTLDALNERVDTIGLHEEAISRSLSGVGTALATVSRTSETSAQVLEQLRDNLSSRDGELERIIRRQNTRFTTMLSVAIVLSMAALTAVVVFGYLGYEAISRMK